jgi:GNAT superfamily N-acetyltransferase
MSDAVTVRQAEPGDVEAVVAVAEDAWYAAYGGFLEPATVAQGLRENYEPELVEAGVDHEDVALYVAEVEDGGAGDSDADGAGGPDGEVVGFASAERTWADEVELHTIYVHPDRWGEGVGTALFEQVEAWAREQDVDRVAAAVFVENSVGVGFFEAMGFERGTEAQGEIGGELRPEVEFEYGL